MARWRRERGSAQLKRGEPHVWWPLALGRIQASDDWSARIGLAKISVWRLQVVGFRAYLAWALLLASSCIFR